MSKPLQSSPTASWRTLRNESLYGQLKHMLLNFGDHDDHDDGKHAMTRFDHDNIDALVKLFNAASTKGLGSGDELTAAVNGIALAKEALSLSDVIDSLLPVRDYVDSINHHKDHARFASLVKSINDNYSSLLDDIAEHGGAVEVLEPI